MVDTDFDIIVIGAGHAGCEAALAAARNGLRTLMLTIHLDSVALMPCNPSIGGTGKGHLVREVDALGGEMAKTIDKVTLSSRMLNTAKGPAVHSLRAQADRHAYHTEMKRTLEAEEKLQLKQEEVIRILADNGIVAGVATRTGMSYGAKAVILATGTYLKSRVFLGDASWESGPSGLSAASFLSESLKNLGFTLMRLKTGTPPRLHGRSINTDNLTAQYSDSPAEPFSFENESIDVADIPCYMAYTNKATHDVIKENIHRSPLFSGEITGTGPRYCPSIEDKIVRFADKERHQLFVEPEGAQTREVYLQGMSSSLPEDVQIAFIRTLEGFEDAQIMRPAYAIEYDAIDPTQLKLSLESKIIDGLFFAGQINGTSGYEEAACQGLIAGINAAARLKKRPPLILERSQAYTGVLIDDIVTKGTKEPYRIMTSRVEHRLLLRQDNADIRLTPSGYRHGLITRDRYERLREKERAIEDEKKRLKGVMIKPSHETDALLSSLGTAPLTSPESLYALLKRPQTGYEATKTIDPGRPVLPADVIKQVALQIRYEDYIEKASRQVDQAARMEGMRIPPEFDYSLPGNLRMEARNKLASIKPENLGQASRISGVSPSDITALLIALQKNRRNGERRSHDSDGK